MVAARSNESKKLLNNLIVTFLFSILFFFSSGCGQQSNRAPGYIEGRYTYIATPVSGVLKASFVERGQKVMRGQPLFMLEAQPESDAYAAQVENLRQSKASRDAILANLDFARLTFERYKVLVPKHAIEQSALDNAKSIYNATVAQLAKANADIASSTAQVAEAKWTKDQKTLYAPVDALVFDTYYRLGEYTEANQAIVSLLAPADIKAIFFVNEQDLAHLQLQDKVSVQCDGCAKGYIGTISFISPTAEYTPPVIYSNETREKLIFRIEAEFKTEDASRLHPGQPISVVFNTHDR